MRIFFQNIPQELKDSCLFCNWNYEKKNGRNTKVPYNPRNGQRAKVDDPSTFSDYATAARRVAEGRFDGLGIMVSNDIGAIDIDHCIRDDGSLTDIATDILSTFKDAYFEKSPSGSGLRGFFKFDPDFIYDTSIYYINNSKAGLEVYAPGVTKHFMTVTGDVYRNGIIAIDSFALSKILENHMKRKTPRKNKAIGNPVSYFTDEEVVEHAAASKAGDKFTALMKGDWEDGYGSHSDADMALASILAFWCGCVEEQMDRIFRTSGLMRPKWDRAQSGSTYGAITIRNAILSCNEVYRPLREGENIMTDFTDLDAEKIQEERDRREKEGYTFTPDYRFVTETFDNISPHTNPRYASLQIGNGRMFVDYYHDIILSNSDRKCWYIYDGRVWRPDVHGLNISELAKEFHDLLLAFAATITSEDTRERFLKRVDMLDQRKYRDIMVKDSMSDKDISVKMDAFDRDKFIFNCHNGTIDLRTGEFRPHSPSDLLTKMTEVDYVPDATCPRWLSFMDEIMEGDSERIRYLQKAIGYAMSGDTRLECMFILYGATSRNGKGTTMETVLRILGEYGRTAKPEMLSKKGFSDSSGPSEDVARLNGARMVNVSEPEKSMQIDASLTKQMTGNNILTARYLRENSFEFKPQFKLFIDTNHLPQISDMTLFESDRINIIPFYRHFKAEERDIDLKAFFAKPENLSGILNWCLEGFRMYADEGLTMPDSVREATKRYREQSDRLMMFRNQCLKNETGQELRAQSIYSRYKDWCADNGYKYENATNFRKKMEQFYVYQRRRPWNEKNAEKTTMVNDVAWVTGEELEEGLLPEFQKIESEVSDSSDGRSSDGRSSVGRPQGSDNDQKAVSDHEKNVRADKSGKSGKSGKPGKDDDGPVLTD